MDNLYQRPSWNVEVDGHLVDARLLDQFHSGKDGSRLTDAEWDEMKRRMETDPTDIDLGDLGFEYVGTVLPQGDEFGEEN